MTDANDAVTVGGDFRMGSMVSHQGYLTNGTLCVNGNIVQTSYGEYANFVTTDDFRLVLGGSG